MSSSHKEPALVNKPEAVIQPLKVELPTPLPQAEKVVEKSTTGSHQDWMKQAGISESDWDAVEYIISRESAWRYTAVNPTSGATGLCQALPAQKMQSAGLDYMTSPITQLKWCHSYAQARYGGWQQAKQFWIENRWW